MRLTFSRVALTLTLSRANWPTLTWFGRAVAERIPFLRDTLGSPLTDSLGRVLTE